MSASSQPLPHPPLLRMRGIRKAYPGVQALRGVDLTLHAGEVLALVGENGAGKSTLMKILGGAVLPDSGDITLEGQPVQLPSPQDSQRLGIAMIYQEFNLIPALSARENIFLGRERTRAGFLARAEESREAAQWLRRLGVEFSPETPCRQLSVAHQQAVEIAKALARKAKLLVLDEPTAALTPREVDRLFALMRELRNEGLGLIFIGHRLEEIFAIADRVLVLRDGATVAEAPTTEFTRPQLIERMVGRDLKHEFPARTRTRGPACLTVRHLSRKPAVHDVSFTLHRGEILALAGLVGAGRTELARLLFGADPADTGLVELEGKRLHLRSPRDAIQAGLGFLTEDRKAQGLVLGHSALDNFALPNLARFAPGGWFRPERAQGDFAQHAAALRLKVSSPNQPAQTLSGGNQQKLVMAKWLARHCSVLIFDEPTRGIDVGAKFEIYTLMDALAAEGRAILMVSSDLPEIMGMADRILVMHQGRLTGEISDVTQTTPEQILELAIAS